MLLFEEEDPVEGLTPLVRALVPLPDEVVVPPSYRVEAEPELEEEEPLPIEEEFLGRELPLPEPELP